MEIKILNKQKNEIEVSIDSVTVVEILRTYLNEISGVDFAAWKREHFTMSPILKVKTTGKDAKAVIDSAIKKVISDLEKTDAEFKKLK